MPQQYLLHAVVNAKGTFAVVQHMNATETTHSVEAKQIKKPVIMLQLFLAGPAIVQDITTERQKIYGPQFIGSTPML